MLHQQPNPSCYNTVFRASHPGCNDCSYSQITFANPSYSALLAFLACFRFRFTRHSNSATSGRSVVPHSPRSCTAKVPTLATLDLAKTGCPQENGRTTSMVSGRTMGQGHYPEQKPPRNMHVRWESLRWRNLLTDCQVSGPVLTLGVIWPQGGFQLPARKAHPAGFWRPTQVLAAPPDPKMSFSDYEGHVKSDHPSAPGRGKHLGVRSQAGVRGRVSNHNC